MSKEKTTKESLADKLKLTSYSEMLGLGDNLDENDANVEGQIIEVPLSELHTFRNHPFRVLEDEKMDETVESIKAYGVLVPGLARERAEGGYEILSGHRRKRASELAGKETMPVIIKNVSDDEAVVIMVDANIQREDILPSEKAKAYAMKFEALKHQGKDGNGGLTIKQIGDTTGESAKTVQRYIQLSRLSDSLLQMVDDKKIGFGQGCDISFLDDTAQVCEISISRSSDRSLMKMNYPISRHYLSEQNFEEDCYKTNTDYGTVRIYNMDRSVCECIYFRDQIEPELYSEILKSYLDHPQKNLDNLYKHAAYLRVSRCVEEELEKYKLQEETAVQSRRRRGR